MAELQKLLVNGAITSAKIVELYLAHIAKHNHAGLKLNAIISIADQEGLFIRARELSAERQQGKRVARLTDLYTTFEMPTTCESFAFKQGRATRDANVIETLNEPASSSLPSQIPAMLIMLQELRNAKGSGLMAGWPGMRGQVRNHFCLQTQNPYVRGGVDEDGPLFTNSGRGGSYSGKAVAVAAGFTPDGQGPYAKTTADVATLSAILQLRDPSHYLPLQNSWEGLRVAFVDPTLWRSYPTAIELLGGRVVKSISLASWGDITGAILDFEDVEELFPYQLKRLLPGFLQQSSKGLPTLEILIKFHEEHADLEFTKRNDNQNGLEEDKVDVVLGPCDSRTASVGAAAGFPVGNLPLGFAFFNGRPFSLHVTTPANEEEGIYKLFQHGNRPFHRMSVFFYNL
ncbi:hypothetical protein B0J13DRAFT_585866 [Dactylonectria estremocensis]|uniref:Amidase domain-containing protein n=1 Tax=Dactylonectria estremocensis TaxID=1079267 RepID=A0A9P9EQF8_9HYPO|nr:hypothetical protein B0J13DRAFT_585866 [Dactylonectria estremocensis]